MPLELHSNEKPTKIKAVGFFKSSLIFFLVNCIESSNATLPCYHNQALRDFLSINNNIQHVAVYGDRDRRQTTEGYATLQSLDSAVVKSQFAATGRLNCNGEVASAQVTLKDNIITTVSHVLSGNKECKRLSNPKDCKFSYRLNEQEVTIDVESLVDQGYKCPKYFDDEADWAVMRLKSSAVGIKPYRLPSEQELKLKEGQPVIAVADRSDDFQKIDPRTGRITFPKHFEDCHLKKVYGGSMPYLISHNCASSDGASGGSILSEDFSSPALLAIFSGASETQEMKRKSRNTGVPNMAPYNEKHWSAGGVPVNGAFLEAIQRAAN